MTRRVRIAGLLAAVFALGPVQGWCSESNPREPGPWEKVSLDAGAFLSAVDTSLRLGSGVGISLDGEELLGLDTTTAVFRVDGRWRFSENRRHRLDLSWYSLNRKGSVTHGEEITVPDPGGGEDITIPAGAKFDSRFDLDIYHFAYSYSFLQDERLDLAGQLGLYVMPIKFDYSVFGLIENDGKARFTAPLPTIGLRFDVLLAPKWYLRSGTQIFYLKYKQFKGTLVSVRGALEYNPWENLGLGVGVDSLQVGIDAEGEDYPGIDFKGSVDFRYVGLQLYGRVFF